MKQILKISLYVFSAVMLSSCLKSKNDIGGLRTDDGSIAITIAEFEYIEQDNNVIGFGYYANANFDFSSLPNEDVKFFSVRVSQPRNVKVNGTLKLKVTMQSIGSTPIPAGAITIPTTLDFPAFDGTVKDFSAKFKVNKALLNPAGSYAARFTITGTDQGAVSATGKTLDVVFHNNKYTGRYMAVTTVTDPAGMIKIDKNTRPVLLDDFGFGANYFSFFDEYHYGLTGSNNGYSTLVENLTTGTTATRYALLYPTFQVNASGGLVQVYNSLTAASYAVTLTTDTPNKFTYTANDDRTFEISYNITVTAPLTTTTTSSRVFKVVEKYTYHPIQVRVF